MTSAPPTEETRRIAVLDGLRALAIALVLARHSLHPFWPDAAKPFAVIGGVDFGAMLLNGWVGVDLFFVLSGFLITRQLLAARGAGGFATGQLAGYFRRRFLRIAPAYYLVLTLVCIGVFPLFPSASPETVWGWRYVYHLLFLQDYFPPDICVVFWSLAIEIKFYLLAPLLVAALARLRGVAARTAVLLGMVALMAGLRYATVQAGADVSAYEDYFAVLRNRFHLGMDGLLAGMLCAYAWDDAAWRAKICAPPVAAALFAAGCAVILALVVPAPLVDHDISLFDQTLLFSLLAAGFSAMMLGALGGVRMARIFAARALAPLARWSYSLYLVHLPLLYPAYLLTRASGLGAGAGGFAVWAATLPAFAVLSVSAAALIYRLVEKPFIDYSRKA